MSQTHTDMCVFSESQDDSHSRHRTGECPEHRLCYLPRKLERGPTSLHTHEMAIASMPARLGDDDFRLIRVPLLVTKYNLNKIFKVK